MSRWYTKRSCIRFLALKRGLGLFSRPDWRLIEDHVLPSIQSAAHAPKCDVARNGSGDSAPPGLPGISSFCDLWRGCEEPRAFYAWGFPAVHYPPGRRGQGSCVFGSEERNFVWNPSEKDAAASGAYDEEGVVQMAVRALKDQVPELTVIADVCLCEYMDHGHCGVVGEDGKVDNDLSLELLAKTSVSLAEAGVDVVAPSDMMDGRVAAIRGSLDQEGFVETPIISYSTKYASSFYGPFRDAAESPPGFGDRRSYQMDPANSDEGVREAMMDIEEGADMVMVKPALPYLDLIWRLKTETRFPVAAYSVSGEYAMITAAAEKG